MIDWKLHAHNHELGIEEVQKLNNENKNFWGWANGMMICGTDDFIAMRFLKGFDYEPVTRHLWRELCKSSEIAVDVGTHSGVFTLDAWRAGAKNVLSVEPNPFNYSRLIVNLRKNNFRVDGTFYGAAGEVNGVDNLLIKGTLYKCYAAGRMGLHNQNGIEIPVKVARVDKLIPEKLWPGVGVVKIDAENWTPQVLKGMTGILHFKPDLIVECTNEGMEEILKDHGYKYWRIWETGNIEEVEDLKPHNPGNNYNGTDENCRNRFCSVKGLPQ